MSKILVVDDEPLIVDMIAESLSAEGHTIERAFSGEEALEKVEQVSPDLVVLDLMLPGIDGLAVARQLHRDARFNHIPIIMLTAKSAVEDKIAGYEKGADDYITKPFEADELIIRVRRQLQHLNQGETADLTGLPGNKAIERVLKERTADNNGDWAIIYVAISHFDAFNESVSFAQGDAMIKAAATALQQAVKEAGNADDFLGYIGSDDFVIVTHADSADPIMERATQLFAPHVAGFFRPEDRQAGTFNSVDHSGKPRTIRLDAIGFDFDVVDNEV